MKKHAANTRLSLCNAEFYAFHGVREEERTMGGRYQVDVDIIYDASSAVVSDILTDTVNYEEILYIVNEHMSGEPCELIESLAYDIGTTIVERFLTVKHASVRVRKLNVPIQQVLDYVEAEITIGRDS
ncbi:MAG: dihydroneopterin aldolase [Ignavibacteria bacterium]|nr:dihydroneopterin aldolase [Ignavibacteria bacterium]